MADQSDVEAALVSLITSVLYPNGLSSDGLLSQTCKVFRGWPNTASLRADLAAGRLNVSVFPDAETQNTTRWPDDIVAVPGTTPSLSVHTDSVSATFTGTADAGQLAGLLVDQLAVVHRTVAGDTPELVAAILGSMIRRQRIVTVLGATVTVPGVGLIVGRVVADQAVLHWTRSQRQRFRVTFWCPDPTSRDRAAAAVDAALSRQAFMDLDDGTTGRLRFVSTTVFDQSQDAALYRRDLIFSVDYLTTVADVLPSMIFGDVTLAPIGAAVTQSLLC
jgi:hypothetical protein